MYPAPAKPHVAPMKENTSNSIGSKGKSVRKFVLNRAEMDSR